MSTMHFSRPRSAQSWVSEHEKDVAAECSSSLRLKDKHVQSVSSASFCARPVQAHPADDLSSSLHNDAHESSIAASTSARQAPDGAALHAEPVCEQSSQAAFDDLNKKQEVQLEHLEISFQPETGSYALGPDTSSLSVNRQDAVAMEQLLQSDSKRHLGVQASSHSRTRLREQEWPPQGARWRSGLQYKLQANPMHLPTAKVCTCLHALCCTCGVATSSDVQPRQCCLLG